MKKLVVFFLILGSISFGVEENELSQGSGGTQGGMTGSFAGGSFTSSVGTSGKTSLSKSFTNKLMPRTKATNDIGSEGTSSGEASSSGGTSSVTVIMPPTNIMVGALVEPYPGLKNN